jgi:hypothetical protein
VPFWARNPAQKNTDSYYSTNQEPAKETYTLVGTKNSNVATVGPHSVGAPYPHKGNRNSYQIPENRPHPDAISYTSQENRDSYRQHPAEVSHVQENREKLYQAPENRPHTAGASYLDE